MDNIDQISAAELDDMRRNTLVQLEKTEKMRRLSMVAVALLELVIIGIFVWLADFGNRTHLLVFVAMLGIWAMVGMGLIVLGILQKEASLRVLNAIESIKR